MVQSSFVGCNLTGASFTQAWIRNVDFTGANLAGADFTEADWFNASGLVDQQVNVIAKGTLMACPVSKARLLDVLDDRYAFPIGSFDTAVREQILASWNEYLRPGGLRDIVVQMHS